MPDQMGMASVDEFQDALTPADIESRVVSKARAEGVDEHLARAIARSETSGFDPNAVSKKGAQGIMQLMPDTGREMGVTDPFDVDQNIAGGVKYLKQLQGKYGNNWGKIAQAYNAGP